MTHSRNPNPTIAIIGLGYVGLPLAVEFGKKFKTLGFDLAQDKIDAYKRHLDPTGEVATDELRASIREGGLEPTTDARRLASADFLIVAVKWFQATMRRRWIRLRRSIRPSSAPTSIAPPA